MLLKIFVNDLLQHLNDPYLYNILDHSCMKKCVNYLLQQWMSPTCILFWTTHLSKIVLLISSSIVITCVTLSGVRWWRYRLHLVRMRTKDGNRRHDSDNSSQREMILSPSDHSSVNCPSRSQFHQLFFTTLFVRKCFVQAFL